MTRKRWRIERVMVVPAQWQGSVEHFYHFFLGYFMPLVLWQERTGTMAFTVRDCGPMNPWFELLRPGTDLDFMQPGTMLQRVLTRRQAMQILHGWDDPTRFHRASLDTFVEAVRARVNHPEALEAQPRITVLDRRPTPAFYLDTSSEVLSSGADWRSIPNMTDVAQSLENLGRVTLLDTAALTPREQVEALANSDLLVAQHGAGLANMVWMPEGSAVLEIKPPLAPTINEIFANLAAARGLDHLSVDQADEHAAVDIAAVNAAATRLVNARGTLVPVPTGRWPLRALRQLPRRL